MRRGRVVPSALLIVWVLLAACDAASSSRVVNSGTPPSSRSTAPPSSPTGGTIGAEGAGSTGRVEPLGALHIPRAAHTATRLRDGRILVAGGCSRRGCGGNEDALRAELFDPELAGSILGPPMTVPRAGHTATLIPDGTVLIVGGYEREGRPPLASAEVFDPASTRFVTTGSMAQPRGSHTATALGDGRVLVVGGVSAHNEPLDSVEIYDPATGMFTAAAPLPEPRAGHAAVLAGSGAVLVAGGTRAADGTVTGSTLLYDAARDTWTRSGDLRIARAKHAVAALPDGGVIAIGGADRRDFEGRLTSLERWEPASGTWTVVADTVRARFKIPHAAAVLSDGRVVIAGDGEVVEVFDPADNRVDRAQGALDTPILFATATTLDRDRVLIVGGYDEDIGVAAGAYVYRP